MGEVGVITNADRVLLLLFYQGRRTWKKERQKKRKIIKERLGGRDH